MATATAGGASRTDVVARLDAAGGAPRALGGDRVDRASPGDVGDEALPVVDDVRRRPSLVGPALSHHAEGDGVERAGLDRLAKPGGAKPPAQLAGSLAGERQRQRVAGVGGTSGHAIGDAAGQHSRLARAGGGDDGDERRRCRDGRPLVGVEVAEQSGVIHEATVRRPCHRTSMTRRWGGAADTVWPMSYPKKLLNDYEELAVDLHPHWLYFFEAVFALIAAIVLGVVVVAIDSPSALKWIALILILGCAVWVVVRYVKWMTTNFVITSDRVIFRHGVFAKSGIEIPLERVNSVHFGQSIIERIVGAGNLLIESGAEGGQQRFTDVHNPDKIQNLIHAQMEQNEIADVPGAPSRRSEIRSRRRDGAPRAPRGDARTGIADRCRVRGAEAAPAQRVAVNRFRAFGRSARRRRDRTGRAARG